MAVEELTGRMEIVGTDADFHSSGMVPFGRKKGFSRHLDHSLPAQGLIQLYSAKLHLHLDTETYLQRDSYCR